MAQSKITFKKLSEARSSITFPELSLEEKKTILGQVRMILGDVFVHRDLKIKNWGPEADPLPALDRIEADIEKLSTTEFHSAMVRAFQRVHDFHTSYYLPKPYSCYRTLLPPAFRAVKDENGKTVFGVDLMATSENFWKEVPKELKFAIGDVLVKYDGKSPEEFIASNVSQSQGANAAAVRRDGILKLAFRTMKYDLLPEKDSVELTLRDKDGVERTMDVPWITKVDESCLNPPKEESSGNRGLKGINETRREYNEIYAKKKKGLKGPGELIDSREPILKYKTFVNEIGYFGYLRLDSFDPMKLTKEETVREVKRILDGALAMTHGLVIDLRGNPGGRIYIGEAMVQLLTPKYAVPLNFHMRSTPAAREYWEKLYPESTFTVALNRAKEEGRAETVGLPLNSSPLINSLGQSYMKPVAVIIDSGCYSTCDMFTASMQDAGIGIIFGEDENTGAGGANNWHHSDILSDFGDTTSEFFKKLPGSLDISFSYRQPVRNGTHAGEVIEDVGVKADIIVSPTLEDLGNDEIQLRKITARLVEESENYRSTVKLDNREFIDLKQNQKAKLKMRWENTDSFDVMIAGNKVGSVTLNGPTSFTAGQDVLIDSIQTDKIGIQTLELLGQKDGKRVWRKVVTIRVIPETGAPKFSLFNFSDPKIGWQGDDQNIQLIDDPYKPNIDTMASVFTKVTGEKNISFKGFISTEEDFDFLTISIVSNNIEKQLYKFSGEIGEKDYKIDLTPYQGKEIELRFRFTSDGNKSGDGVEITDLKME